MQTQTQEEIYSSYKAQENAVVGKFKTTLLYSEPVTLYHGKRLGYIKSETHTVSRLFMHERAGLCYSPCGMVSGFKLTTPGFIVSVNVSEIAGSDGDMATKWGKQWGDIAKSMRKYGINIKCANLIDQSLSVGYDGILELQTIESEPWTNDSAKIEQNNERRMEWCKKHNVQHEHPRDLLTLMTQNYVMAELPRTTCMPFSPETIKDEIKKITNAENGTFARDCVYGSKRDKSYEIRRRESGDIVAFYSSEYSGCGNGDYYMIYSPSRAWYMETD